MLHQASTLVHKYYQLMVQVGPASDQLLLLSLMEFTVVSLIPPPAPTAQATNRWADAKQRPEAVEAVDDGPRAQRKCFDRHPQCVLWREKVRRRPPVFLPAQWLWMPGQLAAGGLPWALPAHAASRTFLVERRVWGSCPSLALALCVPQGECEGNPKYMLGDEGANNGWCRAACGHCPEEEEDQEMRREWHGTSGAERGRSSRAAA